MCREDWWAVERLYQCVTDELVPWPARTFTIDGFRREMRREAGRMPANAERWEGLEDGAPAYRVHPVLERHRAVFAKTGQWPMTAALPAQIRTRGWHWIRGRR